MKLNNRGFAFSTMLYGTLALITVILYAILNVSQSSNDTIYYYGDKIAQKLNECVTEEIALENCYASGSSTCDATSYHACLGISDSSSEIKGVIISEKLKETVSPSTGLYSDPYVEKRYIYEGDNPNNYIEYSGKKWRIVSIEADGTLKLIDYTANINKGWDSNAEDSWQNSTLNSYLNNDYFSTLTDTSKLISGKWQATLVYPSMSAANLTINELMVQEKNQESTADSFAQVGLLTISDYMKATTSNNCKDEMLTATSCTSWLANYKGWTLNINGEIYNSSIAYFFHTDNKLGEDNTGTAHNVYPIVYLNRNSVIEKGDGSEGNPYILK